MNDTAVNMILARLDDLGRRLDGSHVSPWMNTQEAASYLRCSVRKVEHLTRLGLLPYHRQDATRSKSPRLYHRRFLTAYLVAGRNPVQPRVSPVVERPGAAVVGGKLEPSL